MRDGDSKAAQDERAWIPVRVSFYAHYKQIAGTGELVVQVMTPASVRDVLLKIREQMPRLKDELGEALAQENLENAMIVTIANRVAGLETQVERNDELKVLPPISGGRSITVYGVWLYGIDPQS